MKKFILKAIPLIGIAFLFGTTAKAQSSIEIRDAYTGTVLTTDTVYYWVALGTSHQYDFDYYNIGSTAITYKMTKTNLQLQTGASSWFCLYHNNDPSDPQSQCYIPSVTNSGNFVTGPGEFNTLLADFSAGTTNTGTSIVRYKWYDINNPNDSAILTIVYNVTPVGIEESFVGGSMGEPYPNPASSQTSIAYEFNGETSGNAVVTDVAGKIVYNEALNSRTGILSIETSMWSDGIYFVTLMSDNAVIARRKLVVE